MIPSHRPGWEKHAVMTFWSGEDDPLFTTDNPRRDPSVDWGPDYGVLDWMRRVREWTTPTFYEPPYEVPRIIPADSDVPLGTLNDTADPFIYESTVLPPLAPEAPVQTQPDIFETIIGAIPAPNQIPIQADAEMSVDLGTIGQVAGAIGDWIPGPDIFGGIATIADIFSPPPQQAIPTMTQVGPGPAPGQVTTMPVVGSGQMPRFPGTMDVRKSYCLKFRDGQWAWVKKGKRRRKRLATKSDLADLASLKGILGTGKAFEVWIATHA